MDGHALLKSINQLNQDQNIPREVIFSSIEAAIQLAAQKHFGEKGPAEDVVVTIDRRPVAVMGFTVTNGRIAAIDALGDPERLSRLDLGVAD